MPLFVLLSWPVVVALLFSRLDWQRALIWSLLAGYLILAPGYEVYLPGLPVLSKHALPAVTAGIMVFIGRDSAKAAPAPPPRGGFFNALIVIGLAAPLLTAMNNTDALAEGVTYRPGISATFAVTNMIRAFIEYLPFLLAYRLLWTAEAAERLLKALVAAMLVYSIPMLIEVRMSPQMNVWVYGYFQHDFSQTIRFGGFRPIVFLEHPLWVAALTMMTLLAAVVLARVAGTPRSIATALYMAAMLVLCRSAGALILAMVAVPVVLLLSPRNILRVAVIAGTAAFAYPILRTSGLIPLEAIVETAKSISLDRGRSLEFRLMNEQLLLERAMERPLFGWGGGGRSLFYDPYSGRVASIPDGLWTIWLGARGIVGYMTQYLILLGPIWALARTAQTRRVNRKEREVLQLACLALMLAMNLIDLIPNATATPITWLIAGTVLGNARRLRQGVDHPTPEREAGPQPGGRGLKTVL